MDIIGCLMEYQKINELKSWHRLGIWLRIIMSNIVFIVNLPETKKINRNKPYQFSIDSWQKWCDENGTQLVVLDERIYD